jgi:hypothetical protein
MCDFISWIEKDGVNYWSRDDEVLAKYGEVTNNHCGHSTIRECQGILGGIERESCMIVPYEIAASVNRGEMKLLAKAGGWSGAHFTERGTQNASYWLRFKAKIKKYKNITYTLDNHGLIDPNWMIFDTRDQTRTQAWDWAWDQAWSQAWDWARTQAGTQTRTQAWDQAWTQARDQAWDWARDQANVISSVIIDGYESTIWYDYFKRRFAIWEAGYGCLCDVNGVFYVYRKL